MFFDSESEPQIQSLEVEQATSQREEQELSVEERLEKVEQLIGDIQSVGVLSEDEIRNKAQELEMEFRTTLDDLRGRIGAENISAESEEVIHDHLVDEVVAFEEQVLQRYEELLTARDSLRESSQDQDVKVVRVEERATPQSGEQVVSQAVYESNTVGEVHSRLQSAKTEDLGEVGNEVVEQAERNLSDIVSGHEAYRVKEDLQGEEGSALGVTEMSSSGGGDVTIDAAHLATVATEAGKIEVNKTLDHEEIHQNQTVMDSASDGTVVVDPRTGEEIKQDALHEGGALHGTRFHGGFDDEQSGGAYKEGADFYKRHDADVIDTHVNKGDKHSGDRAHLQAELANKAGVDDKDKLDEYAQKAGFSDEEEKQYHEALDVDMEKAEE